MNDPDKIREKSHRLPIECYRGRVRATFTFCAYQRKPIFTDAEVVKISADFLRKSLEKHRVKTWIYLFMPDHMHTILEGESEESDLWKAVALFKQFTGFWLFKNRPDLRWQKDFYDHIHRKDEDLQKHIRYILDNPVRKGLVEEWRNWPYKGSFHEDLEKLVA